MKKYILLSLFVFSILFGVKEAKANFEASMPNFEAETHFLYYISQDLGTTTVATNYKSITFWPNLTHSNTTTLRFLAINTTDNSTTTLASKIYGTNYNNIDTVIFNSQFATVVDKHYLLQIDSGPGGGYWTTYGATENQSWQLSNYCTSFYATKTSPCRGLSDGPSITSLGYTLSTGYSIAFAHPQNDTGPIGDFDFWQIQLNNIPATSSTLSIIVLAGSGSDTLDIPPNQTATSSFILLPVLKSYPLPGGPTSTPITYSGFACLFVKGHTCADSEIARASVIFRVQTGGPTYALNSQGIYTGCQSCAGGASLSTSTNAQDQTRLGLQDIFPFAYFYQINNILQDLTSTSTTASATTYNLDYNLGNGTSSIPIFSDTIINRYVGPNTTGVLKTLISWVLWIGLAMKVYEQVRDAFNGGESSGTAEDFAFKDDSHMRRM